MSKIIVFGATGNQGSSVVRSLLAAKKYQVVGVSRDPSSPKAKELVAAGAEMVSGNLDDPASYEAHLKGAHGVFLATNFLEGFIGTNVAEREAGEAKQGIDAVDAAKRAGVKHFVFSTLDGLKPEYNVPFYESKHTVSKHLRASGLPYTDLYTSSFYSNVLAWPVEKKSGGFVLSAPVPDATPMPSFAVEQIGLWARKVFDDNLVGQKVDVVGEILTPAQYAQRLSELLGLNIETQHLTLEQFANDKITPPILHENNRVLVDGALKRDLAASKKLAPEAWDFATWAKHNEKALREKFAA